MALKIELDDGVEITIVRHEWGLDQRVMHIKGLPSGEGKVLDAALPLSEADADALRYLLL